MLTLQDEESIFLKTIMQRNKYIISSLILSRVTYSSSTPWKRIMRHSEWSPKYSRRNSSIGSIHFAHIPPQTLNHAARQKMD